MPAIDDLVTPANNFSQVWKEPTGDSHQVLELFDVFLRVAS